MRYGSEEAVHHLLDSNSASKVKTNAKDELGTRPLHYAVERGYAGIVNMLLDMGAEIDFVDPWFGSALKIACEKNDLAMVELLLKHGADVNLRGESDTSPLYNAASDGNAAIIELLLKHGADIHSLEGSVDAEYALSAACSIGSVELVQLLLDIGATVSSDAIVNANSNSALDMLLERGEITWDSLEKTVKAGRYEHCIARLDHGVMVTSDAIVAAWKYQSDEFVKLLMDRGASNGVTAELFEEAEIQCAEKIGDYETEDG